MRRSIAPLFWVLFGAGGMLAALTGPALVLITGIAAPHGIGFSPDFLSFARASAFAHHLLGKLVLLALIVLFVWHGAERIYLTLRDMRLASQTRLAWLCYGTACLLTLATLATLLTLPGG